MREVTSGESYKVASLDSYEVRNFEELLVGKIREVCFMRKC